MVDTVEKTLGRIEAQVEVTGDDVKELKALLLIQNGRIRILEIESARSQGGWKVAGIIGALAGTVSSFVPKFWGF